MQIFIISHSPCAEQYCDMSADTHTHTYTHSHTHTPPTAGVQLVGNTSIIFYGRAFPFFVNGKQTISEYVVGLRVSNLTKLAIMFAWASAIVHDY